MATKDEIQREVISIVAAVAEIPPERVAPDAMLADLDIDSLRGLRIVAEVEKKWGILIDEDAIGKIRSMRDILALVENSSPRG